MASYLLFLPNTKGADPAQLARVGLASLHADRGPEFAECFDGPEGCGNLAFWSVKGVSPVLQAKEYDWTPAPADKALGLPQKRFWLGVPKGQKVTPDACQREAKRPGYWILAADGQQWEIPAAAKLPHKHGLNEQGEFARIVADQYRDYWSKSEKFAIQFFEALDRLDILAGQMQMPEEKVEFTLSDTWDFCCQALAINYRLDPAIVSMLGLIDDDFMANAVKAAIDLPVLIDCKKKDVAATVSIPLGLST